MTTREGRTANFSVAPPSPPAVHQSGELLLLSPEARLRLLDAVFLRFDELVAQTNALKVETIASVYLVAANGAPAETFPCVATRSPSFFGRPKATYTNHSNFINGYPSQKKRLAHFVTVIGCLLSTVRPINFMPHRPTPASVARMPVANHVEVLSRLALQFIEVRGMYGSLFREVVSFGGEVWSPVASRYFLSLTRGRHPTPHCSFQCVHNHLGSFLFP